MSFEHIVFITGEINAYSLFLDHLFLNYARFFTEEKNVRSIGVLIWSAFLFCIIARLVLIFMDNIGA